MRAIPRRLLIHTLTVSRLVGQDRWGKGTMEPAENLTHVRLEPSGKIVKTKDNQEVQLAAVLFFDIRHSRPAGQKFRENMILGFNGEHFRVETVEPLYDEGRLHHYEIGLVRYGKCESNIQQGGSDSPDSGCQ
mgnify:CR=1 FL=1